MRMGSLVMRMRGGRNETKRARGDAQLDWLEGCVGLDGFPC